MVYVVDHAKAIDTVFHKGKVGDTYNIGGFNEWTNIDLIKLLCSIMDEKLGRQQGSSAQLITFVKDSRDMISVMLLMRLKSNLN